MSKSSIDRGTALFTKDGRVCGNAIVTFVHTTDDGNKIFSVEFDCGNHDHMTQDEIEKRFYIGDKCNVQEWYNNRIDRLML